MKKYLLVVIIILVGEFSSYAQTNPGSPWTWVKGDNVPNQIGTPGSRRFSASWKDNDGNFWLFGGYSYVLGWLNDLWKYDPLLNEWEWVSGDDSGNQPGIYGTKGISDPTNKPGSRVSIQAWVDASNNFWIFGGYGRDAIGAYQTELNDLWKYDPSTNLWTWIKGDSIGNKKGVYGTQGTPSVANNPGGRALYSSWVDASGKFWLFGGAGLDAYNTFFSGYLNDLWRYDPSTNQWTWISGDDAITQSGIYGIKGVSSPMNKPGSRGGGNSWIDNSGNFWLFGGDCWPPNGGNSNDDLNDLWKYNPNTNQWIWMNGDSTPNQQGDYGIKGVTTVYNQPGARYGSDSWKDDLGNFWLFGGVKNNIGEFNDLWKYDLSANQWTWVKGDNTMDQLGIYGTQGVPDAANKPGARSRGGAWIDEKNNLWLFGGAGYAEFDGGDLNDLWGLITILNAEITNTTCGNSNGSITVYANYGSTPYIYSIDGITFQSSNSFTNLAAGTYTVTVKDALSEIRLISSVITNESSLSLVTNPVNETCSNSNGTLTVTATLGTPPFQYSIDGTTYQSLNTFTGLSAGSYTVYAKDASNCLGTSSVIIADDTLSHTTYVTGTACLNNNGSITIYATGGRSPFQYSINGITFQSSNMFLGLNAGNYTVYVKDFYNCLSSSTVAVIGGVPSVSAATTASSCSSNDGIITVTVSGGWAPYYYGLSMFNYQASNVFTGLAPGTYTIYVKDFFSCIGQTTVVVAMIAPSVTGTMTPDYCSAHNGTITATATGGSVPYQYSIDGASYQTSNLFTGLAGGNHTIYVKDANGCITTRTVTIDDESAPSLSANTTAASCSKNDGTLIANAVGGKVPLQYSINGTTYQSNNVFTGLASGNYTVSVKDANACVTTYPVTVSSTTIPPISGISIYPNPINNNQFTLVLGNQLQGSYSIRILDMTGQLVYKTIISNTCTCCTGSYSIKLPFVLSSGVYNVEVIDPVNNKNVQRLIVTAIK